MRPAWRVIAILLLILLMGFSVVFSSGQFSDTSDKDSVAYKIKHADVYVGKLIKKGVKMFQ